MKTISKSKINHASLLNKSGMLRYLLKLQGFCRRNKNSFRILFYHRINNYKDPFTINSVSVSDFKNQMKYIAKSYNVLSLEQIYTRITQNENLPDHCLAITFDDGYEDNYTNAFPILKKYDLPATIFLTAGCIDSRAYLWFDQILYAFKTTGNDNIVLPWNGKIIRIITTEQKLHTAHLVLEYLKKTGNTERIRLIDLIVNELGISSGRNIISNASLLDWSQIREMSRHKISFGSHTMTHPILTNISEEQLQWELESSRKIIEKQTGKPVYFIAYPNGQPSDYNDSVIQSLKQSGYRAAMTTEPVSNDQFTDCYKWGRYKPWQDQVDHFAAALLFHGLIH